MKNNKNISRKDRLKSKKLAPANYLIVCEGKQTEPNYFNGLKEKDKWKVWEQSWCINS